MEFQNNTTDLSTQSYIDFKASSGSVGVNASKVQVTAQHEDLIFGKGTFQMNVSHIYSSCSHIASSCFGQGWKLNIEQYIFPYKTSMGLKGFNTGDYVYLDGNGRIHQFVSYGTNRYYDKSGQSIFLVISNSSYQLQFPDQSELLFDTNGRLTQVITRGRTKSITKKITYDSSGKIIKFYDIRCTGEKERYVGFEYSNSLLKKMYRIEKGKEVEAVYYTYQQNDLCGIFHYKNQNLAEISYYSYDSSHRLVLTSGTPEESAISITYSGTGLTIEQGFAKLRLGTTAPIIAKDSREYVSLDDKVYLNSLSILLAGSNNLEELSLSLSTQNFEVMEKMVFTYASAYVDMKNLQGITYRTYFNTDGEVTSQFEVLNNALRTCYKEGGYSVMNSLDKNTTTPTLNQKRILSKSIGSWVKCIGSDSSLESDFKGRNYEEYRECYCYGYAHFKVGFFVKHTTTNATYMNAVFQYKNLSYKEERVSIDVKATNAWQYVEIPFSIGNEAQAQSYGISEGSIKIESDGTGSYDITNITIDGAERSFIYLDRDETKQIKDYYSVNLTLASGESKKLLLGKENFLTPSDLSLDWLSFKKKDSGDFDFVLCNGKKAYRVKTVAFQKETDGYSSNPSNYIFSFGFLKFRKKDISDLQTTASFTEYYNGLLYTYTEVTGNYYGIIEEERDLQGRVIYSIDPYGKKTVNEYDSYGNLLSTIVAKKDDFDKNNKFIKDRKRLYLLYTYKEEVEEYRETISSIKNEEASIECSYNEALTDLLENIRTNDGLETSYTYDCVNRLAGITQKGTYHSIIYDEIGKLKTIADNDSYAYEMNSEANHTTVSLKNKTITTPMSRTSFDYTNNTAKEEDLMLNSSISIEYNSYQQPKNYCCDGNSTIGIAYQEIGDQLSSEGGTGEFCESLSAAEIKSITCPFTNQTYDFTYDHMNQVKEYKVSKNQTKVLSILKEDPYITKYSIGGKDYVITKEVNHNPFQERITKTKVGTDANTDLTKFTYTYEYHPVLGTITKKTGGNSTKTYSYENKDNAQYYSTSLQEITQKYGSKSFNITYNYNQNKDIIKMFGSGEYDYLSTSYSYDENHRIAKEGNSVFNVDYKYEYNTYNRLDKVLKNSSVYKEFSYDAFGRLLTVKKNGTGYKNFEYSNSSLYPNKINGLSCKFGRNGLLYSYGDNTYTYDYAGVRYSKKTSSNITVQYYYAADKLLGEDYSNGIKIRYMYDQEGITGARYYSGSQVVDYEYVKDGYGNVIAIMKDNTIVVKYYYDAWGNILHQVPAQTNLTDPFAKINPIRYRSYYYDIETGYYYLQSRYYDPEIGAFISPDSTNYLDIETIGGLNLYIYCYNNPLKYSDPHGHKADLEVGWFTLSNLFDFTSAFLQGIIGLSLISSYACVKNAIRPNNIGMGIWLKRQAMALNDVEASAKKLDTASKILAVITIIIQVGEGVYKDVKRDYSVDRIISNAVVNTVVYGVTTWAIGAIGGELGALIGSFCPIPIVGTVAGSAIGYAIGVGVGFLLNLEINGKSILDHIEDGVYYFWKSIFS